MTDLLKVNSNGPSIETQMASNGGGTWTVIFFASAANVASKSKGTLGFVEFVTLLLRHLCLLEKAAFRLKLGLEIVSFYL